MRHLWLVIVLAACGSVKGNSVDAGDDDGGGGGSDAAIDAPDPAKTVKVAPTGDDGADGHVDPVRSLKRALAIAAADPEITGIAMEAGTYDVANGETFPYTISTDLTIAGPAAGGAILHGAGIESALVLSKGKLRNLELDTFSTALTTSGSVELGNIKVRESAVGLRGNAGSMIVSNGLDLTSPAAGCKMGVTLEGDAQFISMGLTSRRMGIALQAIATSSASLTGAMIIGDPTCADMHSMRISNNGMFRLVDSTIDGGRGGINFGAAAGTTTTATVMNTTMKNMTMTPGTPLAGRNVVYSMTGGALSNNVRCALETSGGNWSFTNVEMKQNQFAMYLQGDSATAPGVLKMRGCTVTGNQLQGIYLFDNAQADLGTDADPGGNTFSNNGTGEGLIVDGNSGPTLINAVGNTWRPNVQGANAAGAYTAATVNGPITGGANMNYRVSTNWSLRR